MCQCTHASETKEKFRNWSMRSLRTFAAFATDRNGNVDILHCFILSSMHIFLKYFILFSLMRVNEPIKSRLTTFSKVDKNNRVRISLLHQLYTTTFYVHHWNNLNAHAHRIRPISYEYECEVIKQIITQHRVTYCSCTVTTNKDIPPLPVPLRLFAKMNDFFVEVRDANGAYYKVKQCV